MTLILTLATPSCTLQVTDRVVSIPDGKPHDLASNKNIIYRASNAIVSMGYAGRAYVHRIPTDEWIARQLWGKPLPSDPDGRPAMAIVPSGEGPAVDLNQAVVSLTDAWAAALGTMNLGRHELPHLSVAGWQRGVKHPLVWNYRCVRNADGSYRFDRHLPPRWALSGNRYVLCWTPPAWRRIADDDEGKRMLPEHVSSPGAAQIALVQLMRSVAAKSSGRVGEDCLCILIPKDGSDIRVRFESASVPRGALPQLPDDPNAPAVLREVLRSLRYDFAATYSPWIVAPGGVVVPPSLLTPGWRVLLDGIAVRLDGEPENGMAAMSPQLRPKPP